MAQAARRPQATARPGHHWRDPELVRRFVRGTQKDAALRKREFSMVARLMRAAVDEPETFVDLGAGYGALAGTLLRRFPAARAVCLDVSEPMIEWGQRMYRALRARMEWRWWDFADGELPPDLTGPFDAVVSSLAIHHLPATAKKRLFGAAYARLRPGGIFVNLDVVPPRDEPGRDLLRRLQPAFPGPEQGAFHHQEHGDPLDAQLAALRAAGFVAVECWFKEWDRAVYAGLRPA